MGEWCLVSGVAMCFFGWGLFEECECNIGDIAGVPNSGAALTGAR
jgi:hypothetical protein